MFNDRQRTTDPDATTDTRTVKGPGLARGPALIVGAILSAAGLILFLHAGDTPTGGFPDGDAFGRNFLGFESNGWTAWFTTAAGALLLFGAAQHLLAKAMSLIVGLALAAAAVIGLIDGSGVLGMAAANHAVELAWAIAAVILLVNVLLPRIERTETLAVDDPRSREADRTRPTADHVRHDPEPVATRHDDHLPPTDEAAAAPRHDAVPVANETAPAGETRPGSEPPYEGDTPPHEGTPPTGEPPGGGSTRLDR